MRGGVASTLERTYQHSHIADSLVRAVAETETVFPARLAHAQMIAAMYGNSHASLEDGNEQVHKMYVAALNVIPYMHISTDRGGGSVESLVEEWRRLNEEEAAAQAEQPADSVEER